MRELTMDFITARIINILGDHEHRARCAVHEAWINGIITAEQDSIICEGITELFDAVVEAIQQSKTPDEIDMAMHRFEVIAQGWIRQQKLPCNF